MRYIIMANYKKADRSSGSDLYAEGRRPLKTNEEAALKILSRVTKNLLATLSLFASTTDNGIRVLLYLLFTLFLDISLTG
jgi:hypothetical protein